MQCFSNQLCKMNYNVVVAEKNWLQVKQVFMLVTTCLVIMIYMKMSPRPNCPVTNQVSTLHNSSFRLFCRDKL
jgi:hypothetical protein